MRLPINVDIINAECGDTPGEFLTRWMVDGYSMHEGERVRVCITNYGASPDIFKGCMGHELGHAEYQRGMSLDEFAERTIDRFDWEASAWLRWTGANNVLPISLHTGKFILDALNTYRRGYNVPEQKWNNTRRMVETWVRDSGHPEIEEYEPLEPPENSKPPLVCGEGGSTFAFPAPPINGTDGFDTPDDNETEETPDDNEGTEESDTDTPDNNGTEGNDELPDEESDTESLEHETPNEERINRNAYLHTERGMQAARQGEEYLTRDLADHGWDTVSLPPVTVALMGREN